VISYLVSNSVPLHIINPIAFRLVSHQEPTVSTQLKLGEFEKGVGYFQALYLRTANTHI
jgi:hypothetical protein